MKKKICVVTGSRAEFGLLSQLLKRIRLEKLLELQIIATGMHLSSEFGSTYTEIEKSGFKLTEKVDMLFSGDTAVAISRSIGSGITGFARAFNRLKPDMVVLLGDRFEIFAAAVASFIARIPIAHISGGELSEGVIDDALRHSITKMSLLHFVSTAEYKRRVVQLGESPDRVFNFGAIGVGNLKRVKLLSKSSLESELKFKFGEKTVLVTFHPVTLEDNTSGKQFKALLKALDSISGLRIIFTKPNADTDSRIIGRLIDKYVKARPDRATSFISLGQVKYLSVMKCADVVVGNSSSGIVEAPSFAKPTVNIGDRQRGRVRAYTVIDCVPEANSIKKALLKALSEEFRRTCKGVKNPYDGGDTAASITRVIKKSINGDMDIKKSFYDMRLKA